jgi:hypothetical protein
MASYRVTTVDEQVREILLGSPVTFPWEWSGLDGSPEAWAGLLGLRAMTVDLAVVIATVPRHSLSFAWNENRPSPPVAYFRGVIERVEAARSASGVLILPTKDELMAGRQRPVASLPIGANRLRLVPGAEPPSRPHLRVVG